MKRWITRSRILSPLRRNRPPSPPQCRAAELSAEDLDRQLHQPAQESRLAPPEDLHRSIMRAVLAADAEARATADTTSRRVSLRLGFGLWTRPVVAVILALVAVVWWGLAPVGLDPVVPAEPAAPGWAQDPAAAILPSTEILLAGLSRVDPERAEALLAMQWVELTEDVRATARFLMDTVP